MGIGRAMIVVDLDVRRFAVMTVGLFDRGLSGHVESLEGGGIVGNVLADAPRAHFESDM